MLCDTSPPSSQVKFSSKSRSEVDHLDHVEPPSQSSPVRFCSTGARKIPVISPTVRPQEGDDLGWIMVRRHRRYVMPAITGDDGDMSSRSPCMISAVMPENFGCLDPNSNYGSTNHMVEPMGSRGSDFFRKNKVHQTGQLGQDGTRRAGD